MKHYGGNCNTSVRLFTVNKIISLTRWPTKPVSKAKGSGHTIDYQMNEVTLVDYTVYLLTYLADVMQYHFNQQTSNVV